MSVLRWLVSFRTGTVFYVDNSYSYLNSLYPVLEIVITIRASFMTVTSSLFDKIYIMTLPFNFGRATRSLLVFVSLITFCVDSSGIFEGFFSSGHAQET